MLTRIENDLRAELKAEYNLRMQQQQLRTSSNSRQLSAESLNMSLDG